MLRRCILSKMYLSSSDGPASRVPARHRIPAGAGAVAEPVIAEGHGTGGSRGRREGVKIAKAMATSVIFILT
jgi:hypothetical protein